MLLTFGLSGQRQLVAPCSCVEWSCLVGFVFFGHLIGVGLTAIMLPVVCRSCCWVLGTQPIIAAPALCIACLVGALDANPSLTRYSLLGILP
jgi:hypothetical protein